MCSYSSGFLASIEYSELQKILEKDRLLSLNEKLFDGIVDSPPHLDEFVGSRRSHAGLTRLCE